MPVTDANGCTSTCSIVITATSSITCTTTKTNVSCNGGNNGTATVNATGGSGYTYLWSNAQTNQTATGLIAGTYTVTVTASNGCSTTCTAVITQPASLTCSTSSTAAGCSQCNGTMSVVASGGTGSKTYLWSNSATTANVSNVCSGTYTVTVTDANGCTTSCLVVVAGTNSISCSVSKTDLSCYFTINGTATVNPTGGSGYTYLWSNGKTTKTITGLDAGTFTVTVTSSQGCTTTCSTVIIKPNLVTCSTIRTNATCGQCNGMATVTANGGTGTYTYSWNTVPVKTTSSVSGLCAGTYTVTVTDGNGCSSTCTVVISSSSSTLACSIITNSNVTCNGASNGSLTVNQTGGVASYSYLWSNGKTTKTISNLAAGIYTATVTDAGGCTTTCSKQVTQPQAISVILAGKNVSSCNNNDGAITTTVTGGTAPYSFSWSNGNTNANQSSLVAGIYTVTVTDAKGCTKTATLEITQPIYICSTFYTGHAISWYKGQNGQDTLVKYLDANFNTVFPNGLVLKGSCQGAFSLTMTSAAAVKTVMQGQLNTNALTANLVNPSLAQLNNGLAAQTTTLALNIFFDLMNPNFAPSTVNFKDMVVDTGPVAGLTVWQLYQEGINALTGCGSVYSNNILRTYIAYVNSSWNLGTKVNTAVTCPPNTCSKSVTWAANDTELMFNAYPNPTNDVLNISYVGLSEGEYSIMLYDMAGRLVYTDRQQSNEGTNTFTYSIEAFSAGMYNVKVNVDGIIRNVKIVKR
ncbi:MAG: T9SS type A sorting domain-containing protein [Bacteroidetes bacterium]|nr:T9SS type A sorting domain-containing protein [Bacteroidota bacterium]